MITLSEDFFNWVYNEFNPHKTNKTNIVVNSHFYQLTDIVEIPISTNRTSTFDNNILANQTSIVDNSTVMTIWKISIILLSTNITSIVDDLDFGQMSKSHLK